MGLEPKSFTIGFIVDRSLAETDETFQHLLMGKHRGFTGRAYRRGKTRCQWCGAPQNATSVPVDALRSSIATDANRDLWSTTPRLEEPPHGPSA